MIGSQWLARTRPAAAALLVLGTTFTAAIHADSGTTESALQFNVTVGDNQNSFLRSGQVAAHLVLRSGLRPRVLVAFPAGNSGVGVWFVPTTTAVRWTLRDAPAATETIDAAGRPLYGITAHLSVSARQLQIHQAVLSSVRVLRDYEQDGKLSPQLTAAASASGKSLTFSRERLDGALSYQLKLTVTHGELQDSTLRAGPDGRIDLELVALSGETPLMGLADAQLLGHDAAPDRGARDSLTFLAYREKLLAGSWRFDTYFGRDTLMATRLLLPVLSAPAVESALSSVLVRLSPAGEVAHEEDIGERAVLDHLQRDHTRSAAPVYDYKMIDSSYLLAPVAAAWLLDDPRSQSRAAAFLAGPLDADCDPHCSRGAALVRNLRLVLGSAQAFASRPQATQLIALHNGFSVGNWRDSEDGLGGGRYPYDVNAVLVPAALSAAARLYQSGLIRGYLSPEDAALFSKAAELAAVWRERVPPLFEVQFDNATATQAIKAYAGAQGVPAQPGLAALGSQAIYFHALALDATGKPVPVMHSDEGFELLFGEPQAAQVETALAGLRPFPAGLMTAVGLVVANPVFAAPAQQARFTRNAYHGTVVWSWQQALFAAGLARQLQRHDLPAPLHARLLAAQRTLWAGIDATRRLSNSELWSWSFTQGHYQVAPFGAAAADADESNAAQLWSTVYLAVRPPQRAP